MQVNITGKATLSVTKPINKPMGNISPTTKNNTFTNLIFPLLI